MKKKQKKLGKPVSCEPAYEASPMRSFEEVFGRDRNFAEQRLHQLKQQADAKNAKQWTVEMAKAQGEIVKFDILSFDGPPLTSTQVEKILNLTPSGLLERHKRETIIALRTEQHGFLYPKWQFGNGEYGLIPEMISVLQALRGLDEWAKAVFLLKSHPSAKWASPLDLLKKGKHDEAIALAKAATGRKQRLSRGKRS